MGLILALVLASTCTATPSPSPIPTEPTPTAPPTEPPRSTPPASRTTAAATPTPPAPPASGVDATALGALTGDWVFVIVEPRPLTVPPALEVSELWAVPLGDGEPRLAARFVSRAPDVGGIGTGAALTQNVLRRQVASDGRSLLLNVHTPRASGGWRLSLVILELEGGEVRMVGSDDRDHDRAGAWSPDGRRIAYVRRPDELATGMFDDGLWVMNADGTAPRQILPHSFGSFTALMGWAPDSRTVTFAYAFEDELMQSVNVDSGERARMGYVGGPAAHDWRTRVPTFVAAFFDTPRHSPTRLSVAAQFGAAEHVLVSQPAPEEPLAGARWHRDEDLVLFRRGGVPHVIDIAGGAARRIPTSKLATLAEWAPDGGSILYGASEVAGPLRVTVRHVGLDGSNDRELFRPPAGMVTTDVTSWRYP